MSPGRRWSGSIPAWLSRPSRRGEPDASTSLGLPIMRAASLETVGDATLGEVAATSMRTPAAPWHHGLDHRHEALDGAEPSGIGYRPQWLRSLPLARQA